MYRYHDPEGSYATGGIRIDGHRRVSMPHRKLSTSHSEVQRIGGRILGWRSQEKSPAPGGVRLLLLCRNNVLT